MYVFFCLFVSLITDLSLSVICNEVLKKTKMTEFLVLVIFHFFPSSLYDIFSMLSLRKIFDNNDDGFFKIFPMNGPMILGSSGYISSRK